MIEKISHSTLKKHKSQDSCWVVLYGKVYDVTAFLEQHPGGASAILKVAGKDATDEYDPIHPPGTLEEHFPALKVMGDYDQSSAPQFLHQSTQSKSQKLHVESSFPENSFTPKTVSQCLNLSEIEHLATRKLSRRAWAYYYSASDNCFSKEYNNIVYSKIFLRPRVFRNVTDCSLYVSLFKGEITTSLPIFVSPAAQARLAHPSGEAGIASAAQKFGAMQIISNNSSMNPEDIVAANPMGIFGWQCYVQMDRLKTEAMLKRVRRIPQIKFVVLTLDAPVPGKREEDERSTLIRNSEDPDDHIRLKIAVAAGGVGKALFAGTAMDLTWEDTLPWLKEQIGSLPLVLKGIQTYEDVMLASQWAPLVKGVLLSNHGGRALDTASPALHTLMEVRRHCPEVFCRIDVWIDGGIKRGTDVVKALCLGANAVGIGRSILWGLGAGGSEGVERVFGILKAETETCVKLLGETDIKNLNHQHINLRKLEAEIYFPSRL